MSPLYPVTAFLASLLLVLPTYGALGATSDGGLWAWFTGGLGALAVLGALLGLAVPRALALVLFAASGYLVVALAGVFVVAGAGDPPGNATLALLVGVPAAAVGALLAAAVTEHLGEDARVPSVIAVVLVGMVGVSLAPTAGEAVDDARDRATEIAELEASGLEPYLPEVGDLDVRRSGTSRKDDRVVGYSYRYEVDPEAVSSPAIVLDVAAELPMYRGCDLTERAIYQCRDEDGYYVLAQGGQDQYVVADHGGTYLLAWYVAPGEGLPDADEVGTALAEAERVEWSEVVGLE